MWILLVEDDSQQAKLIEKALTTDIADVDVRRQSTESEFRLAMNRLADDPPALVVMDVMLRWCDVGPAMPERPPECEDFSVAGVRCCHLLRSNPKTKAVPIIVLTVLDKNGLGLPPGCQHVQKTSDFKTLIIAAKQMMRKR